MANPVLVAVATADSGTGTSAAMTVTLPGSAAAGHFAVYWADAATGGATVTGPSGWAEQVNGPDAGNCKPGLWTKTLDSSDISAGSVTATRSVGAVWSAGVAIYSGVARFDVLSAANSTTTATTSPVIPAVTPAVADALRMGVIYGRVGTTNTAATQTSPPSSWSLVGQSIDTNASNRRLSILDSIQLVGQNGSAQSTATATTDQGIAYVAYSFTLAPTVAAEAATGTGTAPAPSAAVAANAGVATGTGTAVDPVTTASGPGFAQGFTGGFGVSIPSPPAGPPAPVNPVDYPQPIIEMGFTTDPLVNGGQYLHWDDPTRGLWDQGLWAPDQVWADVTPYLKTFSFQRGATQVEGPVLRYEEGKATIVLNNTGGEFHPLNLSGPYVSGGRSQIRPMVPVRIRGSYAGLYYELWRGFVDSFDITYNTATTMSEATVSCTDAQEVFGAHQRAPVTAQGAGELSGARVRRILNSVGWPATDRRIDQGETILQATTLEGSAWDELQLVSDTEMGEVYVDPNGKVVFKGRHAILEETLSQVSQATFGRFGLPGELPYSELVPDNSNSDLRTVVRIGRAGGVPQEVRDDAAVFEFRERTHERTDLLMQTDSEALDYAQYLLAVSKDPQLRFASITINPFAQPADLFPQCFTRDFGDRITIRSRPPVVGLVERDVFIRGVAGSFGGLGRWQFTWTLQSVDKALGLTWDVSKWDSSAVWGY